VLLHPLYPPAVGNFGITVFLGWNEALREECKVYSPVRKRRVKGRANLGFGVIFAAKPSKNHDKTGCLKQRVAVPPIFLRNGVEQKYKGVRPAQ